MLLIPGDGIEPEVAEATKRVLDATGLGFEWEPCDAGLNALEKHGDVLPEATLESGRRKGDWAQDAGHDPSPSTFARTAT